MAALVLFRQLGKPASFSSAFCFAFPSASFPFLFPFHLSFLLSSLYLCLPFLYLLPPSPFSDSPFPSASFPLPPSLLFLFFAFFCLFYLRWLGLWPLSVFTNVVPGALFFPPYKSTLAAPREFCTSRFHEICIQGSQHVSPARKSALQSPPKALRLPQNLHRKVHKALCLPKNLRCKIRIAQPCQSQSQKKHFQRQHQDANATSARDFRRFLTTSHMSKCQHLRFGTCCAHTFAVTTSVCAICVANTLFTRVTG